MGIFRKSFKVCFPFARSLLNLKAIVTADNIVEMYLSVLQSSSLKRNKNLIHAMRFTRQ